MANSNKFYVGVKKPKDMRKNLLESSKRIIENLKDYEEIRLIREEKSKKTAEFMEKLDEIFEIFSSLKEILPIKKESDVKEGTKKTKKARDKEKNIDLKNEEIVRLETDLAEIEARLNSM